jgi:hypothetical protein
LGLPFLLSGPSSDWAVPSHIGKADFLTRSTDSNANLFWKHPHRHILSAIWAFLAQSC